MSQSLIKKFKERITFNYKISTKLFLKQKKKKSSLKVPRKHVISLTELFNFSSMKTINVLLERFFNRLINNLSTLFMFFYKYIPQKWLLCKLKISKDKVKNSARELKITGFFIILFRFFYF